MAGRDRATESVRLTVVIAVSVVTQVALTMAFTSLAFRDELAPSFPLGLAAMACGLVICGVIVALRSGLPGHLAGPQDSGLVVISAMVPAIVAATDAGGATVVVLMGLASLMVGVTAWALGSFGLGRYVRYLPYPVMSGFLAGTGLVMGRSTISLLAHGITGDATGGRDAAIRLGIGLALAAALFLIAHSSLTTGTALPITVIGMIAITHLGLALAGISRSEGAARGYILPRVQAGSLLDTAPWTAATRADWGVVADHLVGLLPLVVLVPVTLLLYLSAFETMFEVDVDTDREFRLTGIANVVGAIPGSGPSYTQFAATNLIQQMSGDRRIVPAAVATGGGLMLLAGDSAIRLVPQPVIGGLLGFIALSFVGDWLVATYRRMSTSEWVLAVSVAASILFIGFLPGVGLGIALTAGWFVLQYSRISGVRRVRDASLLRSNVERSQHADDVLRRTGARVMVVEPEGFVFFGTGDSITRAVLELDDDRVEFVIIDLSSTTGADSSAAAALTQLSRWAKRKGVVMIWCGVRPSVRRALRGLVDTPPGREAPDLDRALEITEQARLATEEDVPIAWEPLPGIEFGELRTFEPGECLFERGCVGPGLVLVRSGWAEVEGAPGARRRRVGSGAVLGEVGLFRDGVASATVIADTRMEAMVLDHAAIERMTERDPTTAAALYRELAGSLAGRLVRADAEVDHWTAPVHAPPSPPARA